MSSIKTSKIVPLSSALTIDSATTVVAGKLSAGGTAGDNPLAPLQVYGATTVQGAANRGVFLASNATNSRQVQIGINDTSQLGWIEGWVPGLGGLTLCINPTGANVGIGTASPAVALDVSGEARSSTSTTSASNDKTLTTKDYVDDPHLWSSTSMTAVNIGGIIMTGESNTLQGGINWKPGDTTTAMYVGTTGTNSIYRYRPVAISGGTSVPGTFKCIGIGEQSGVNVYIILWQRIA